ncbi:RidA family protein [Roseiterribacter gracilis]|uniref:Enamine deaminase RidA n=1 Tax=Roseiterribacter gracilis TaxID=2812848 RepID=A0A8S8XEW6_9PROT|nr:enamine deaminase RidA [Rhodospirillales bacterium TMPK1]
MIETVQPAEWPRPSGYANGMVATGRYLVLSGQIGWNEKCVFETDDFVEQTRIALENIRTVLAAAGGTPEQIVRLTWYVTDMVAYRTRLREIGAVYRATFGKVFPVMSVVQVVALVEERAKVEIEATAVLP